LPLFLISFSQKEVWKSRQIERKKMKVELETRGHLEVLGEKENE